MTKLFEEAVKAAQGLPPEAQDDIARLILQLTTDEPAPVALSVEETAAITISRAAAARGEFATDEQVREVWGKRGL